MATALDQLVEQLALERIEENLFRGQSKDLGWGTVFGGQVLGQALSAASQTVPTERHVHSFHSYFLRPGDVTRPIIYEVDRIRDGQSFTTRRVVAVQNGQAIFNLAASFQKEEPGFSHQDPIPNVTPPEELPSEQERLAKYAQFLPQEYRERMLGERPFEMRVVDPEDNPFKPSPMPPTRHIWLRATGTLPDDPALHAYLLAYASDHGFVGTALRPHGVSWLGGVQVASIDHVMWFHRRFRVDDWLLHAIDSPAASGARGLVRGKVFTRDGQLVVSTAQEGLLRERRRKK